MPDSAKPQVGKAFDSESLTRCISHPNLLKTFEVTTKSPFLIVTEYCEGGSLCDCVHRSSVPLSWRQRLKVLVDVAKGMEYLHSRNPRILHRDLKSCNVLLAKPITNQSDQPTAKVADFGLSRVLMQQDEAWMREQEKLKELAKVKTKGKKKSDDDDGEGDGDDGEEPLGVAEFDFSCGCRR